MCRSLTYVALVVVDCSNCPVEGAVEVVGNEVVDPVPPRVGAGRLEPLQTARWRLMW